MERASHAPSTLLDVGLVQVAHSYTSLHTSRSTESRDNKQGSGRHSGFSGTAMLIHIPTHGLGKSLLPVPSNTYVEFGVLTGGLRDMSFWLPFAGL